MADQAHRNLQYDYKTNANKVLPSDKPDRRSHNDVPTEVQSLADGRLKGRMGDRAVRSKPLDEIESTTRKSSKKSKHHHDTTSYPSSTSHQKHTKVHTHVIQSAADPTILSDIRYRPKLPQTRQIYEGLLSFIKDALGDQPSDYLCGAADEVLDVMKNDNLREDAKKNEIDQLLGSVMEPERFNILTNLCKKITDFEAPNDNVIDRPLEEIDERAAVNVDFEDPDDEGEDAILHEVQDNSDQSEDEIEGEEANIGASLQRKSDDPLDMPVVRDTLGRGRDVQTQLHPLDIDAHWLQRELGKTYSDPLEAQRKAQEVISILKNASDDRELENQLVRAMSNVSFDFIKVLRQNRRMIYYCTLLKSAQSVMERNRVRDGMLADPQLTKILRQLEGGTSPTSANDSSMESKAPIEKLRSSVKRDHNDDAMDVDDETNTRDPRSATIRGCQMLKLEEYAFAQGSHLMVNEKCKLAEGSYREQKKGYEEVYVPAAKPKPMEPGEKLVPISSLPPHAQPAFEGFKTLNRIQSRIHKAALFEDYNLLICAPTGAGKTNVAVLTMMREIGKHVNSDNTINANDFKIIYIAPMRSLVSEMVANFSKRLSRYNLVVSELTGDHQLSREQINASQVIVCTPEKWDIITRKGGERVYTQLVKLVIFDEVHLLHDDRGPVLEALVARIIRAKETNQEDIRMVGLSATLPNYEHVARFLHVDTSRGLFHFDNTFRPVPLEQQFIGIEERKAIKRYQLMNTILYEKVIERAGRSQVLIFVHSRKETWKTAKAIRDSAIENDTLGKFLREGSSSTKLLQERTNDIQANNELRDLLPYGFAIHHAGMCRNDRQLVEELFADRHIQVLVSTATLAWGVNLPAHTVIIKGTQVYNPEKGKWSELGPLDVLQMLGRAGRPQFDSKGEGILLTQHTELQYYLSLMNQQLPIESQMISRLPDLLNAECVLGNVQSVQDGVKWLEYTYLYIRMLKNPNLYRVPHEALKNDERLERHRYNLIYSAAVVLDECGLVKFDRRSGDIQSTDSGSTASHYYCANESMKTYLQLLKPTMSEIDLFRMFSLSNEFRNIVIREEEKLELTRLMERVPIPVKESIDQPSAKVNVLLQAYISQLKLEGLALMSDMVYVTQSAARLARAIHEIVLSRGWAKLADIVLTFCKMIDKRMWQSMSPLRQFPGVPSEAIRKLEPKSIPFERLYDLSDDELGELLRLPRRVGHVISRAVALLPRFDLDASVQPITRSTIKIELTIVPNFDWDVNLHSRSQGFWILVEDVDGEFILHHENFLLKQRYAQDTHYLSFYVPILDPLPPFYFIKIVSDRWIGSELTIPLCFSKLILPKKTFPPTQLLDMEPQPVSALRNPQYEEIYIERFKGGNFNEIQTQAFHSLYTQDVNVLLCASAGSGRLTCAELAVLRFLDTGGAIVRGSGDSNPKILTRCVYLSPRRDQAELVCERWRHLFGSRLGQCVDQLTGEMIADCATMTRSNIIVTDVESWDIVSRRWKQKRKVPVQSVRLFIVDELHHLARNATLEFVCSRMRYISSQLSASAASIQQHQTSNSDNVIRIVALAAPIANAEDLGSWLHANRGVMYNFHPSIRPVRLDLHIRGFSHTHYATRLLQMARPVYQTIINESPMKPVLVFVASRRQALVTALEVMKFGAADGRTFGATQRSNSDARECGDIMAKLKRSDKCLGELLLSGVAYVHEGQDKADQRNIQRLFKINQIQVLVVSKCVAWSLTVGAYMVIIKDTQQYNGKCHAYEDYDIMDVLHMIGRANRPLVDHDSRCVVMCPTTRLSYYRKFLSEPLPVESCLDRSLHDHFNAEIVTKTIENKQDAVDSLTWTFLYRRQQQNPNYYGLQGVSHRQLSEHLSELVESTLSDLVDAKCITMVNDMDVSPVNLGLIASYYYIHYDTVRLFSDSLKRSTKLKNLLEILALAHEFGFSEVLPVRHHEDEQLRRLASSLSSCQNYKPENCYIDADGDGTNTQQRHRHRSNRDELKIFSDPHVKANVLLQAHLSRARLPSVELEGDRRQVVERALRLVLACVDVLSVKALLRPSLLAMEFAQMLVQAVWSTQTGAVLRQVPHFDDAMLRACLAHTPRPVECVYDLLDLDDAERDKLLASGGITHRSQLTDVSRYCNRYPYLRIETSILGATTSSSSNKECCVAPDAPFTVLVTLERDADTDTKVIAPLFGRSLDEGWWLVVGDERDNKLVSIKRVLMTAGSSNERREKIEVSAPQETGAYQYKLYVMCDSYLGCDQEFELMFRVVAPDRSDTGSKK
ncbi:small nuclear ribonucleoprotein helicase, partial [Fragariocoptes setiger]